MARYIDADEIVYRMCYISDSGGVTDFRKVAFFDEIERMPTFTSDVEEVKHGKWIAKPSTHISKRGRFIHYDRYKCSECGVWNGRHKSDYCPHCGAKMDGGKKE